MIVVALSESSVGIADLLKDKAACARVVGVAVGVRVAVLVGVGVGVAVPVGVDVGVDMVGAVGTVGTVPTGSGASLSSISVRCGMTTCGLANGTDA